MNGTLLIDHETVNILYMYFPFSARLAVKDPGGRPDSRRNKSGRRHKESSKLSDSLKLNKSIDKGSNHGDKSKSTKADKRASARSRR